ncbi:GNAT family N-acetyltransferase [Cutibacterium sp. WCA-380-WT-3A]|uniref:GNAT family N-acetyltransferase n=1 Tax=Cutibacterium porci TaxID=2605781 RepID=A0A7K0J9K9_9ACTN|nr:GNAT family N-acetyltransferase [Cutibacterium porci]MSS46503.1 GNAT family N-acetyltransferase [Cutibacterium porci]
MFTRVRVLDDTDVAQVTEYLQQDPVGNMFLLSRIQAHGLNRGRLGCPVVGVIRSRELQGVLHLGANVVPVAADDSAIEALASKIGPWRTSSSMMGRAEPVLALHHLLSQRYPRAWGSPREVRASQPLLELQEPSRVGPDPRVAVATMGHFQAYFQAAVAMYTEEVGVSPIESSGGYMRHMRALLQQGHCFAIVDDDGTVRWKSDVGVSWRSYCQIQGVWLDPAWRGKGLADAAMTAVAHLCRRRYESVSLYVNDFNTRALAMYDTVGFRQVGEMATVLY